MNQTGSTAKRGASFYFAGHCVGLPMIYWGMVPLIVIRLVRLAIIFGWQGLATWLPAQAYEFRWA